MKIQIWSDVLCPFCFIGKRNLEMALSQFEHRNEVHIEWKSFELDPGAPKNSLPVLTEVLARKYGRTLAEAHLMNERMTASARSAGLEFQLDKAIPTNSFDAHRLLQLSRKHGKQDRAEEILFSAYLTEGKDIADPNTLKDLAALIGLPEKEVQQIFETDAFTSEVRDDEEAAYQLSIQGVPFFLIDEKFAVSGAQPSEHFLEVLNQVWQKQLAP